MSENSLRITKDQFSLWKNSPVTQTVFRYLEAYAHAQKLAHLDRWINGEAISDPDFEVKVRGVIIFVNEFISLEYDELEKAYGEEEVKDE